MVSLLLGFWIFLNVICYIAGVVSKLLTPSYMMSIGEKWYVLFFYFLNLLMVGMDIVMYVRNYKFEQIKKGTLKNV